MLKEIYHCFREWDTSLNFVFPFCKNLVKHVDMKDTMKYNSRKIIGSCEPTPCLWFILGHTIT